VATLDAKTNVVCCCIHSLRHEEQGHIASAKREYLNAPAKITPMYCGARNVRPTPEGRVQVRIVIEHATQKNLSDLGSASPQ